MSQGNSNSEKLSVVILTKNNSSTIEDTLISVFDWVDEIIVLDSGSTDDTLNIAKKFNCNIQHRDFTGFGEQKRYGVSLAKNDWILILDSDEVITKELKNEIILNIPNPDIQGYLLPITLVFLGKKMNHGRENKFPHLRLFNRKFGNFNTSNVHENIDLNGKTLKLKNEILHYSYKNLNDYFKKFNFYTELASIDLFNKGRKVNSFEIILRFPLQFIQTYFIHRNFLNGFNGFIWSLCSSFYPVIKLTKLKQLNDNKT